MIASLALVGVLFGGFFLSAYGAMAQEVPIEEEQPVIALNASAGKDRNVVVGRTVLFDASATTINQERELEYLWDFGDGYFERGIDATHAYNSSGTYRVTLTVTAFDDPSVAGTDEIIVSVQDRLALLISDQSVSEEEIQDLQAYGLTQGTLVVSLRDAGVDQEYIIVQNMAQMIAQNEKDVIASDVIITWTSGNVGLNSLIELSRLSSLNNVSLDGYGFGSKVIVAVSNNQSLTTSAQTAQRTFQSIEPQYIVVADKNILDDAIRGGSPENFEKLLSNVDAEYQIVTQYTARGLQQLTPLNFMSFTMTYMINKGVPVNSLFLILMLPVMATVIAAARQFLGVKAFGIFAPTVIALSFLATGLLYGVTIFIAIVVLGTIARLIARRFRLLYLPRMAIVLSLLALSIFAMFFVGALLDVSGFISISIFPILIMTVLTEHFVSVQIEQGMKTAIKLTIETLILSVVGYLIGDWTFFKTVILAYPELILLTLVFNYFIGKFTGLRVTEYFRFKKVFKHISNAERSK